MAKHHEFDHIVNAFNRHLAQTDKSFIEDIPEDELLNAKIYYSSSQTDSKQGWYLAIVERLEELKEIKNSKENRKFQIKLSIWNILFGVVGTLLALYVWSLYNK